MKQRRLFNQRFVRDIIVVLLLVVAATFGVVSNYSRQARHDVSERYIEAATESAAKEFASMTKRVEASLEMVREWGMSGLVSARGTTGMRDLLLPIFGKEEMLSGISVADTNGYSFFIMPDGTVQEDSATPEYDPRGRPWFLSAISEPGVSWTKPYTFHTLKKPGISASQSWDGAIKTVIAFDILLDDLVHNVQEMAPSSNSLAFIARRDEHLYTPDSSIRTDELFRRMLVQKAHAEWSGSSRQASSVVSLRHDGRMWWYGFQPLEQSDRNTWIAVMVPESDILIDVKRRMAWLWGGGLFVALWAVAAVAWLIRRHGRTFGSNTGQLNEADIRELIAEGENRAVEFKSTMRMNLHAKKPGKEIELAWLKGVAGFLNTDGGTLLIGVTDDGEITGLERDVFENDDKCRLHFKNLIATHIGADLSKYVRFMLVPVDQKTVGVVYCARSAEPVFLKDGNKEHFYIRNGPSSDELPVSKALKYIKHRK